MCRRGSELRGGSAAATISLASLLGLSLVFLLVAGIRYGSWIPLLNLAATLFVPVAAVFGFTFGGKPSYGGFDETKQAYANFGACFLGTVLASMVGLPLVLLHAGVIDGAVLGLWLASSAATAMGAIAYGVLLQRRRDDGF